MRITVRNLGPLEQAEIDLKPLTILVGPNNVGKTWLAYTLAGILGSYGWTKYLDAYIDGKVSETYPMLDKLVQEILDNGNAVIDLVQFTEEEGEQYINHYATFSKNWLQEYLCTERISFDTLEIQIKLEEAWKHTSIQRKRKTTWLPSFSLSRKRLSSPRITWPSIWLTREPSRISLMKMASFTGLRSVM